MFSKGNVGNINVNDKKKTYDDIPVTDNMDNEVHWWVH